MRYFLSDSSKKFRVSNNNKRRLENEVKIARKNLILSFLNLIIFIILMILGIFFMFNFLVDPFSSITIFLFIFATVFYILLMISIERFLFTKEMGLIKKSEFDSLSKKKLIEKEPKKNIFKRMFDIIEKFPYEYKFKGYKKIIVKYLGWFILIFVFFISVVIRVTIFELQSFDINLRHWVQYFGFNVFVCFIGCIVLYTFSRANLSGTIKLSVVGVAILIQVVVITDYFFFPWELPYDDILWNHFFRAFFSFLLDPKLSYATGIGHPVLLTILIALSFSYIFIKRSINLDITGKKKFLYPTIRSIIGSLNFYVMTIYAMVMFKFSEAFISIFISSSSCFINLAYSMLSLIYFSPLFIVILYKIIYDERNKNKNKLNAIFKYLTKKNNINIKIVNNDVIQVIESKYKPRYFIKLTIFSILLLLGIIILFITMWAYPLLVPSEFL